MLFETSGQKQGSKPSPPPAQPTNVAGQANKGIRSPSPMVGAARANSQVNASSSAKQINRPGATGKTTGAQNTVIPKSTNKAAKPLGQIQSQKGYTTTTTQQAPVTGWPSQQAAKKPAASIITSTAGAQKGSAITSVTGQQKAQVTGWPSHQQSLSKAKLSKPTNTAPLQIGSAGTSGVNQQKAQVKGWPSRQQSLPKTQSSKATSTVPIQKVSGGTSTINQPKAQVKGWPSRQQSLKSRPTTSRLPYSRKVTPAQRSVKGGSLPQASQKPLRPTTSTITTKKNYQGASLPKGRQQIVTGWRYSGRGAQRPQTITTSPIPKRQTTSTLISRRTGQRPLRSERYYTTNRNYITNTTISSPNQPPYAGAEGAPSVQTSVIGWPSNRAYSSPGSASQPCDCPKCNNFSQPDINTTQSTFAQTSVPQTTASVPPTDTTTVSPKPHVCKTCGLKQKGCTTLSGFAINTALLAPNHKQQLRQLAFDILQKNSNAVVATGYTNSSKTEQLVENLGERRALAVVSELKRQLSKLKPNAHKSIFWKTLSKAVTQQDSISASGNRRVEICVRQLR